MPAERPNILLVFTDQQRADTIRALGHPVIRTPNLDRLVREGTAFTRAYTASPVCVSARCSLVFGQYPFRTGCYDNGFPMPDDRATFMDALAEAGYRTHGIGKCHFVPDRDGLRGFQSRESQEELVPNPEKDDYLRWLRGNGFDHLTDPHGVRGEMYYVPQPAQMPARLHPTQWIGDRSVAFLSDQERRREPWFLFASFIDPHPPFAPPAPWHKLYRATSVPLPNLPPDGEALLFHVNRVQNRYKYRDQGFDLNLVRCLRAYYWATISFIDHQIGRMLAALEESGQLDRTLVLFTSDHGEYLGDYGCFGKRGMHDASARIPLLARLPGRFPAGRRIDAPANIVDVAPTALAAAGTTFASHAADGIDLASLAAGASGRELVYSQYQRAEKGLYMAAGRRWKYVWSAPDDRAFLFDAAEDPAETRDRAGVSLHGAREKRMREALVAWLRAGGEEAAVSGDGFRRYPRAEMPANPDASLLIQDHSWANQAVPGYAAPDDGGY